MVQRQRANREKHIDREAAYAELQRPRAHRKARITGTVEDMLPTEVIE